jgi:hypothetical protein
MSIAMLMNRPVTLLHREPGDPDEYGDPVNVETEQATTCELQLIGAREELNDNVQVTTWRVFLPADAPASGWDAVRLEDGRTLELTGEAWQARNPRTREVHHVEAYLEGTE